MPRLAAVEQGRALCSAAQTLCHDPQQMAFATAGSAALRMLMKFFLGKREWAL